MARRNGKIYAKISKLDGLELHVRFRRIENLDFLDLRDYVPSTKTYGRGVLLPLHDPDVLKRLAAAIEEVAGDG